MYQPIKAVSNLTNVVVLVVFGDTDWAASRDRYVMMIAPGGYYLLSIKDKASYRGEWHVIPLAEEAIAEWTVGDKTTVRRPVPRKNMTRIAKLDSEGIVKVTEFPNIELEAGET